MAKKSTTSDKTDNGKLCAILSYLLIGIIWYLADDKMKKDELAKFHVKQGIVLLILSIVISAAGSIIPIIGWFIILPIGQLIVLILVILGIINAANSKQKKLPIIGDFADKLKF